MHRLPLLSLLFAPLTLAAQQATAPHDSVRGAIRVVDVRARTLEVITGVGYAVRVVRLDVPADVPIIAAGVATLSLADLKPGDLVAASYGSRAGKFVAYGIRRAGRMETGPVPNP